MSKVWDGLSMSAKAFKVTKYMEYFTWLIWLIIPLSISGSKEEFLPRASMVLAPLVRVQLAIHWGSNCVLLDIVPDDVIWLRCGIYMPGFHICVLQAICSDCLCSPWPAISLLRLFSSGNLTYCYYLQHGSSLFFIPEIHNEFDSGGLAEHWFGHSLQMVKQIYED